MGRLHKRRKEAAREKRKGKGKRAADGSDNKGAAKRRKTTNRPK